MNDRAWWRRDLSRYRPPPPALRPGADACWCCGQPGREYAAGWLECAHPEGPVRWYGGTAPAHALSRALPVPGTWGERGAEILRGDP